MYRKLTPIIFPAVFIFFFITSCTNSLLDDITKEILQATTISAPAVTGAALTNDRMPSWSWSPVPDADYYRFGFSEESWIESASEDLTYTPASNLVEGTHTFYVQAGKSPDVWSQSASFATVIDLSPPNVPVVSGLTPTDDTTPEWSWNANTDVQLYRYGFSELSWINENVTVTAYTPASELPEGEHTLYVQARDPAGNWSASGSYTITIDQYAAINPPVNPSPASGSTVTTTTPMLDWEDLSAYAGGYQIQVNDASDFTGTMIADDATLTVSEYEVSTGLSAGGTYYWRVKVKNTEGVWSGTWSDVWNFIIPETWAMTIGGTGNDSVNYIAETSDGGFILTGYNYTVDASGELWIVKHDAAGDVEWQKAVGGTDDADYGYTVLETSDNGFIVAGNAVFSSLANFYVHPWIIKLDSSGNIEAEKMFSGTFDEEIYSIQQTADGGYIACGFTDSFSADSQDAWVFKLDSSLAVEWEYTYGGDAVSGKDYARSVRQTSDGGYIVAGQSYSFKTGTDYEAWIFKLTSTGAVSWGTCYGRTDSGYDDVFFDVKQTSDSGYIATGFSKLGTYDWDYLTLKVDSGGNLEWINNIGVFDYNEQAFSILETPAGDFIIGGLAENTSYDLDAWLIKINSSGDTISWQKSFGGSGNDLFNAIDSTSTGGFIGGGYTYSYGAGQNDAWIIRTDSSGDCGTLDTDTGATVREYGDSTAIGDFLETATSVTVTATSATVNDTSAASNEAATSAATDYQVP